MKTFPVRVPFSNGLHGRPAMELVHTAQSFESEITIAKGARSAAATRMIALMTLCVKENDTVTVTVSGPDEEAAAAALERFFRQEDPPARARM